MPNIPPWHCLQSVRPARFSAAALPPFGPAGELRNKSTRHAAPSSPSVISCLTPVLLKGPLLRCPLLYPQVYDWVDFQKNQSVWRPSRPSLNSSLGSTVPWLVAAAFMGMVPEEAGEYLALTVWQHAHANAVPDPQVKRCRDCP